MTAFYPEYSRVQSRFMLELMRLVAAAWNSPGPPNAESVMILTAVVLGTLEGRPFRKQKLANFLHIPRTSVARRLAELERDGWITYTPKGHVTACMAKLNSKDVAECCDRLSTLIHRTSRALLELERKENKTVQIGH